MLASATLLLGCGARRFRPLTPLPVAERKALEQRCAALFPQRPWEAVHVVEASLPLGHETALLGAINAKEGETGFRAALLSQEGIVLFDGSSDSGRVEAHRAVPPLDEHGFGEKMMGDIRFVLFPPSGTPSEVGHDATGLDACRWQNGEETIEASFTSTGVAMRRLDAKGRELRTALLQNADRCGFAEAIELSAPGKLGYDLRLVLVERTADGCALGEEGG